METETASTLAVLAALPINGFFIATIVFLWRRLNAVTDRWQGLIETRGERELDKEIPPPPP